MTKTKTLEQQLADSQKKSAELQKKIRAKALANKPKTIMDKVRTLADVLKIAKPTIEELRLLNYKGKSKRILLAKDFMVLGLISEVLNEGDQPKIGENRHYPYFDVSSGFVFGNAGCADSDADSGSASRLCLKSRELAIHAGKVLTPYYKQAIV